MAALTQPDVGHEPHNPVRDDRKLAPTEDLDREPDGVPHSVVGLTAAFSVMLALLVAFMFIAGGGAVKVAAVVLALIAARAWSRHGGIGRLLLLASACLAAPTVWSGGLLAGPAATAYIVARNPSRFRAALVALAIVSVVAAVILVGLSHRQITENDQVWEHHKELWPRPVQAVLHTFQAIAETIVLANLGLDAVTTPYQSVVLVAALAGVDYRDHELVFETA